MCDMQQKWRAEESLLIKVERPDAHSKLISSRFKFKWSDHLDAASRSYLDTASEAGDASGGVQVAVPFLF